jgi:hypothetical protein
VVGIEDMSLLGFPPRGFIFFLDNSFATVADGETVVPEVDGPALRKARMTQIFKRMSV